MQLGFDVYSTTNSRITVTALQSEGVCSGVKLGQKDAETPGNNKSKRKSKRGKCRKEG